MEIPLCHTSVWWFFLIFMIITTQNIFCMVLIKPIFHWIVDQDYFGGQWFLLIWTKLGGYLSWGNKWPELASQEANFFTSLWSGESAYSQVSMVSSNSEQGYWRKKKILVYKYFFYSKIQSDTPGCHREYSILNDRLSYIHLFY